MNAQPVLLKLIANDVRWALVTALTQSDYRVQELVSQLAEPQNLVSYHLKQLRDAHLVVERRSTADARDIYYSLDLTRLQTFYQALGAALHPALTSEDTDIDAVAHRSRSAARILFLCTENSARSQMAEGILRHLGGSRVEVFSAGTQPSSVHPYAVRMLAGMDIDIHQQHAKHAELFHGQSFDYIITVCDRARENCPTFPGNARNIHWSLPDPVAVNDDVQYQAFEQTARQLMIRIRYFLAQIDAPKGEKQ